MGAELMHPYLKELSGVADTFVHVYPNAGLPNPLSETGYDETPEDTSSAVARFASEGLINVVGGCCGTTPAHIKAIKDRMSEFGPRQVPESKGGLLLSGLEPMNFS